MKNKYFFFLNIKMNKKTLKFNNIRLNKKEFHKSKEPIDLLSVNLDQIVVSNKFKHNNEGFKHFIGYQEGETVKSLCIILPQMSGYVKTCLFLLKMAKCGINMIKFGMGLKIN